jgi:fructose-1,6-bisphosphatase
MPGLLDIFKEQCIAGYSLRHSGCMGLDCYQIFIKGQGIYSKFDTLAHPSNLHLIYEILPIGFLIEKAGGKTDDGNGHSVLDTRIVGGSQRISFIAGNAFEVNIMR